MQRFEVTQKLLALGPTYQVREEGAEHVRMTVKGKLLSATPKLSLVRGEEGDTLATMNGNFWKTKFVVQKNGEDVATMSFPVFQLKKGFTLSIGSRELKADGGLLGAKFTVKDANGQTALEIEKKLSLKDKFEVRAADEIPVEIAAFAAAAIDQRFFQDDGL